MYIDKLNGVKLSANTGQITIAAGDCLTLYLEARYSGQNTYIDKSLDAGTTYFTSPNRGTLTSKNVYCFSASDLAIVPRNFTVYGKFCESGVCTQSTVLANQPVIQFGTDLMLGNQSFTGGGALTLTTNTMVVSKLASNTNTANTYSVSPYSAPTTGKNVWQTVVTYMQNEIVHALQTADLSLQPTPGQCSGTTPITSLNFTYANVFTSSTPVGATVEATPIIFVNNCHLVFGNGTKITGSGTIINIDTTKAFATPAVFDGGTLDIMGTVSMTNSKDTFGYISFQDPSNTNGGILTLHEAAQVQNTSFFTTGKITIMANNTSSDTTDSAQFLATEVSFPDPAVIKHSIFFNRATTAQNNPAPLFNLHITPSERETQ